MEFKSCRLGELCKRLSSGKSITAENIMDEGQYPVFGANGLRGYTDSYNFDGSCAVIGRQGAYCGNVKYVSGQVYMSEHAVVAQANEYNNSKYLAYKLGILQLGRFSGQAAQPGLSVQRLSRLLMEMPEKVIQDKVANILSKYDDALENNNKRIQLMEQVIEKIYKHNFSYEATKKCLDKKFLSEIITITRGVSYSTEEIECEIGNNLINLKNLQGYGGYRLDGTKKYDGKFKNEQTVNEGDLIMGITDMTQDRRTAGSVALIPSVDGINVISADLIKINSSLDKIYLYCLFRYGGVSKYLAQFANGANVLHLRPDSVLRTKIQLPSKDLIDKFIKIAKPLVLEINKLNEANFNLAKQRDLLLPRLMSGKLEVK